MSDNRYLGANELVLVFRNGTHCVLEEYEYYEPVFSGHYEDCVKYMDRREAEYLEEKF